MGLCSQLWGHLRLDHWGLEMKVEGAGSSGQVSASANCGVWYWGMG